MIVISVDILLRLLTVLSFFLWWLYWTVMEDKSNREKPKTIRETGVFKILRRWLWRLAQGIMILQLLGLQVFPLSGDKSFILQIIGFILVIIGVSTAVSARRTIGTNWAHAFEYQVKKKQELVTTGVYAFIRHPIYAGLWIALIGGEFVAQSYVAFVGVLFLIVGYYQARLEEKLLISHFGTAYKTYMKRTKMFIPFLW